MAVTPPRGWVAGLFVGQSVRATRRGPRRALTLLSVRRPATADERALYDAAREARDHAYAPYSQFPVGAALRLEDGSIVSGANIENASFGPARVAEQTAVFSAAFGGARSFSAVAVAGHDGLATLLRAAPAGRCSQSSRPPSLSCTCTRARSWSRRSTCCCRRGLLRPSGVNEQFDDGGPALEEPAFRSGFVGLAGRPNVGKSTLTNALCRDHVAIVSDKPQTTRRRLLGVVHVPGAQLVLADLPGFQRPRDALTERMQRAVDESLADVDAVLLVLEATSEPGPGDRFIAARVSAASGPP